MGELLNQQLQLKSSVQINSWCSPDAQHLGGRAGKSQASSAWIFSLLVLPSRSELLRLWEDFALPEQHLPLHFQEQRLSPAHSRRSFLWSYFHTQTKATGIVHQNRQPEKAQGTLKTPNHQGKRKCWSSFRVLQTLPCSPLLMQTSLQPGISATEIKLPLTSHQVLAGAFQNLAFIKNLETSSTWGRAHTKMWFFFPD